MSNNSTLPATGDVIAAEEIAGAKLQRVKLALGAFGTDDGDAGSANPLPVQASALPLPAGASTEATLAALNVIAAAIQSAVVAINTKTTAVNTGASAGTVWSVMVNNGNAAARYLKLYNKASAPTVGTDVPFMTIPIPAGGFVQVNPGSNGIRFATGIAWALTGAATDADTTAVAAGEHKVVISYT